MGQKEGNVMYSNPNRGNSRKEKKMNAITKTVLAAVLVALGLTQGAWAADLSTRDSTVKSQTILLDGSDWRVAADPKNTGREEKWFEAPRPDAKATPVPGIVQNVFPFPKSGVKFAKLTPYCSCQKPTQRNKKRR